MNMVSTVDGKVALGQSAAGIGSRTDSLLMRQVRAGVDAIIYGAGTVRAELVDPRVDPERSRRRTERCLTPQPITVVVSGSLELDPTNRVLVNGPDRTVIFTTVSAAKERRQALAAYATLVVQDGRAVDLSLALRHLYDQYGVRRLLSEGGPSLNQRLLDAGLIDEIFWTIAPKVAGGHGPNLIVGDEPAGRITAMLALRSLFEHQGELYARYGVLRDPDGRYRANA
jgi:riboflavin-specific deaminase-like protein